MALLPILGIAGVLLWARALEMTGDSLSYAQQAADGENLYHPHHLIFTGAVRVTYLALGWLTGHWDVRLAAQLHNLAFLALGLFAIFQIGRRRLGSATLGYCGMLLWAGTSGVLVYTTQVEVYIPAIACLATATAVLLGTTERPGHWLPIAGWWTLGVLYHQTSVLWAIPLGLYLLKRRRLHHAILAMASAGFATLGAYVAAFLAKGQEGLGFVEFCLYYVEHGPDAWGASSNLGGDGLVALAGSQWQALSAMPARPWALGLLACWLVALVVRAIASWRLPTTPARDLLFFALTWYLAYGLFFWWWLPTEVEFCVLMTVPLLLATLGALAPLAGRGSGRAVLFLLTLISLAGAYHTLYQVVLPRHHSPGADHASAQALFEAAEEGPCLVLARHRTLTTFRFYHSKDRRRSYEITKTFQLVAEGDASRIPAHFAACRVVEGGELLPSRFFRGATGRTHPEEWLAFVRWLLGARPCPGEEATLCVGSFRWIRPGKGPAVLRIDPGKERFESPGALLFALADGAQATDQKRLARDLRRWVKDHPALTERTAPQR